MQLLDVDKLLFLFVDLRKIYNQIYIKLIIPYFLFEFFLILKIIRTHECGRSFNLPAMKSLVPILNSFSIFTVIGTLYI